MTQKVLRTVAIRFEPKTYEKLVEAAKKDGRNCANYVMQLVLQALPKK